MIRYNTRSIYSLRNQQCHFPLDDLGMVTKTEACASCVTLLFMFSFHSHVVALSPPQTSNTQASALHSYLEEFAQSPAVLLAAASQKFLANFVRFLKSWLTHVPSTFVLFHLFVGERLSVVIIIWSLQQLAVCYTSLFVGWMSDAFVYPVCIGLLVMALNKTRYITGMQIYQRGLCRWLVWWCPWLRLVLLDRRLAPSCCHQFEETNSSFEVLNFLAQIIS